MAKPKFDPSKPIDAPAAKPRFDPSRPVQEASQPVKRSRYVPNTLASGEDAVRGMSAYDRLMAGVGAGFDAVGKNVGDLVTQGFDPRTPGVARLRPDPEAWEEERRNTQALSDTTPGFIGKIVGETAGMAPATMAASAALPGLLPPAVAASAPWLARALPKAARMAFNAAEGFGQGYLMGGPGARKEAGGIGAAINAVGGPLLGKALAATYRGVVKPTAAALKLMKEGVSDLTIGQMSPRSWLSQFEEAGTSSGAGGNILKAQRQRAVDQWKDVVLRKTTPPGMPPATEGSTAEKLAETYRGFNEAYGPIKASPVPADMGGVTMRDAMSEAFRAATEDPMVMAPQATRDMVGEFLGNQATLLDRVPMTPWPSSPLLPAGQALPRAMGLPANAGASSGAMVPTQANPLAQAGGIIIPPKPVVPGLRGTIPAGAVMKVRENIREEIGRQLSGKNPDYTSARFLENAEEPLTNALDTHLPKDAAKKLRGVDSQYRKYKTVEDTVRRAGDAPDGFRPTHLEAAVKAREEAGNYARGAGGVMRDLSAGGREVFDGRVPLTGARYLTAGPMHWVTSPMAAFANTSWPKAVITGTGWPQRWAQAMERSIESKAPGATHTVRMGTTDAATTEAKEQKRRLQLRIAAALRAIGIGDGQ